jgi:hypothetical protein
MDKIEISGMKILIFIGYALARVRIIYNILLEVV